MLWSSTAVRAFERARCHHDGLISFGTYETIQPRIKEGARGPACKDINADFALRGLICCDDCNTPLIACWSTSKSGQKRPQSLCHAKGCPGYAGLFCR